MTSWAQDRRLELVFDKTLQDSLDLIVDGETWHAAEANAKQSGGHLVSIGSKEENDFIEETAIDKEIRLLWTDLRKEVADGKATRWYWAKGEEWILDKFDYSIGQGNLDVNDACIVKA